jgi:hypothetical protein
MKNLYYACDWVIPKSVPFERLIEVSQTLECGLVSINDTQRAGNGYVIQVFAVQISAKTVLDELIAKIGAEIGLDDWHPITAEEYLMGVPFLWDGPPIQLAKTIYFFEMFGRYNERVRQKLDRT